MHRDPYGCEVIEAPPPAEPLSEWSLVPGDYYLVVCRLEPENHVLEIFQAFQRSCSSRKLIVVGSNLTETRYVAQLRTVHDPRIRMIGTVYDQAKLTCLRYHAFAYMHGHSVGGTNRRCSRRWGVATSSLRTITPSIARHWGLAGSISLMLRNLPTPLTMQNRKKPI